MKPVDQTIFTNPEGNCMAACIASVLEVPLEAIPDDPTLEWKDRFTLWAQWLLPCNLIMYTWRSEDDADWTPPGYVIASGPSPRGNWDHAVVCHNGEMAHDPHPSRAGVKRITEWTVFAALDPARALTPSQEQ